MIGVTMLAQTGQVWLNSGGDADAGGTGTAWWILIGLLVLCTAAAGAVSWLAWRDRSRSEPEDRAFRALVRKQRLTRRRVALVRQLATSAGLPAVAILLSEGAFDHAVAQSEPQPVSPRVPSAEREHRDLSDSLDTFVLTELRRSLFGETA